MKRIRSAVMAGGLLLASGCQDFLDVNTNPNAPQEVAANMYLSPMLHWLATGQQFDGRYIGQYTQQWVESATSLSSWQ